MKHLLFILLSVHFCIAQNVFEGHLLDAKSKAHIYANLYYPVYGIQQIRKN